MKTIIKTIVFSVFVSFDSFSQKKGGFEIALEYNKRFDVNFTVYTLEDQIIKKIDSPNSAKLSTPEGLIQSHFSASNDEWVKSNYLDPNVSKDSRKVEHFEFIKKMDRDKNVIRLIDKYCFTYEENKVCNVLYLIEYDKEEFKFPTVLSCINKNDKWYIYNLSNQFELIKILMALKPVVLNELLIGKPTNEKITNDLIRETRNDEGGLDILKLFELTEKWKKEKNIEKLKYFTNQ